MALSFGKRQLVRHLILTIPRAEYTSACRERLGVWSSEFMRTLRKTRPDLTMFAVLDIGTFSSPDPHETNLHLHCVISAYIPVPELLAAWRQVTGDPKAVAILKTSGYGNVLKYMGKRAAGVIGHGNDAIHLSDHPRAKQLCNAFYDRKISRLYAPRGRTAKSLKKLGTAKIANLVTLGILSGGLVRYFRSILGLCLNCGGRFSFIRGLSSNGPPPAQKIDPQRKFVELQLSCDPVTLLVTHSQTVIQYTGEPSLLPPEYTRKINPAWVKEAQHLEKFINSSV